MKNILFLTSFLVFLSACQDNGSKEVEVEATDSARTVQENPIPDEKSPWEVGYFVDEYGEKTDNAFIGTICLGEFSNSATTNSRLRVTILVTLDDIRFDLYEYGDNLTKGDGTYQFRAKLPDDTEIIFTAYNDRSGCTSVSSHDRSKVLDLFKKYDHIRFAARTTSEYSLSTYRFAYDGSAASFNADYAKLKK